MPLWKQAIALACLAYWIAAWVIPTFMLPFFNVLPYLQKYNFFERLWLSAIGTATTFALLYALDRKKFMTNLRIHSSSRWEATKHYFLFALGLVMFTCAGAAWNANIFGIFVRALPGKHYEAHTQIENIEYGGSKYKSVTLTLKDRCNSNPLYLTLSKRLFDYPKFSHREEVVIKGKSGVFGTYVYEVERVTPSSISVTSKNSTQCIKNA